MSARNFTTKATKITKGVAVGYWLLVVGARDVRSPISKSR